jgi:hypothetical protein
MLPVVLAVVTLTLWLVLPLGDAAGQRTRSSTAADAAALAAATAYRDALEDDYRGVLGAGNPLAARSGVERLLGADALDYARGAARQAAGDFADSNGNVLEGLDVRARPGGVEFTARTRSQRTVAKSQGQRTQAEASAQVRLRAGLCFTGGGLRLGVEFLDGCSSRLPDLSPDVPPSTPTPSCPPSPSPSTSPSPSPSATPSPCVTPPPPPPPPDRDVRELLRVRGVADLLIDVRLVR